MHSSVAIRSLPRAPRYTACGAGDRRQAHVQRALFHGGATGYVGAAGRLGAWMGVDARAKPAESIFRNFRNCATLCGTGVQS